MGGERGEVKVKERKEAERKGERRKDRRVERARKDDEREKAKKQKGMIRESQEGDEEGIREEGGGSGEE